MKKKPAIPHEEPPRQRGRPKMAPGNSKAEVITFRVTQEEKDLFERAAKNNQERLGDWIRSVLLDAVKKALKLKP